MIEKMKRVIGLYVEGTPSASLRGRGLLSSRHKAREVEGIAGAPGAADRTPLYGDF